MSEERKMKHGDRRDAWLVRNLDPLHDIMNQVMGNRCDNEAVCKVEIEMTSLREYLNNKNLSVQDPRFKYTFFHAVLGAIARTIDERPMLNYFVRQMRLYERKDISFCYVAKKYKADGAVESMIMQNYHRESDISPIQQMHDKTCKEVNVLRTSENGKSDTDAMLDIFLKLPRFFLNLVCSFIRFLDRRGRLPLFLTKMIPYYSSVFVSNLGSIKLNADYHHLVNFGTNSIFVIVGQIETKPCLSEDGKTWKLKEYLPVSLTLDERIADGVYFANSLKILKALLLKPELLDIPANQKIDFDNI